jgi:hypothetical protein
LETTAIHYLTLCPRLLLYEVGSAAVAALVVGGREGLVRKADRHSGLTPEPESDSISTRLKAQ